MNDMGASYTPETWDEWTARMKAEHANSNGHGPSLSIEARRLPTPTAAIYKGASTGRRQEGQDRGQLDAVLEGGVEHDRLRDWGPYAAAIRLWEHLTRPAPPPTEPGKNSPRLAAPFVEWMMGLPAGHVTAVPGTSRNDHLKALGNGVVPQQAEAALRILLSL